MPLSRRFRIRRDDWAPHAQPAMNILNCATCNEKFSEPAARVGLIVVCPACGASSWILRGGGTRRTTADDTKGLSSADRQILETAGACIANRRQG